MRILKILTFCFISFAVAACVASTISSLTQMEDNEINALFPRSEDKENLVELIKIVNSSTDHNTKVNELIAKSEKLSGSVIKLLSAVF